MINIGALLIPVFLLVMAIEWVVSYTRRDKRYTAENTTMNLTIGAIDQIGSLIYFTLLYFVLQYAYNHFRLFTTTNIWYQWIGGYLAVDFLSYWYHRFSHRINILWAGHITHHSSEFFNFSNGFRTSLFQGINRIIFWALLPVFGFSPIILVLILKVSGLFDFIVHTEYIPKLPFLEKIFVTPSLHRVHHGKNELYIDKNYGSTFIIWDKLFGTFQEETEKVKYGITSDYLDNNPITAITYYYQYLWKTMKSAASWPDKIKIWFMPPEWKPGQPPLQHLAFQRGKTFISPVLKSYAYFQLLCSVTGLISMLVYKNFLTGWEVFLFSFLGVYTMTNVTMILNESIKASFEKQEMIRLLFGILLVIITLVIHIKIYLWFLLLFLLISIFLMAQTHYSIKASVR